MESTGFLSYFTYIFLPQFQLWDIDWGGKGGFLELSSKECGSW